MNELPTVTIPFESSQTDVDQNQVRQIQNKLLLDMPLTSRERLLTSAILARFVQKELTLVARA